MTNRKLIIQSILTVLLAFATAFVLHPNSLVNVKYFFRSQDAVKNDLQRSVDLFNKLYASFYVTDGNSPGMRSFPGTDLVMRRIFQDIKQWQSRGQWRIHDLHGQEFNRADVLAPGWAVVETRETWDLWLRDVETGAKTGRRTQSVKIRYHLVRSGENWIVAEFEVFGENEDLPVISEELL